MTEMWTQAEAIELCRRVEDVCPKYGCHVALTGGTLYKDGQRKDIDLLFYRIRQKPEIDEQGLIGALGEIGIYRDKSFGWVWKATYQGRKQVDLFFPEYEDGDEYPNEETDRAPEPDYKEVDDGVF